MTTFTIDTDNHITAHATPEQAAADCSDFGARSNVRLKFFRFRADAWPISRVLTPCTPKKAPCMMRRLTCHCSFT